MARFSERMGFGPVRDAIQVDSMDKGLRVSLWNAVGGYFFDEYGETSLISKDQNADGLLVQLWVNFFKCPLDERPRFWSQVGGQLKAYLFACPWYEVYDFIEFVALNYRLPQVALAFTGECNRILERELSAYRFLDLQLVRITSEQEIAAIEDALKVATPLQPVRDHLQHALALLSDRTAPDYRNSIKESISAVEALCKMIAGEPKATLGSALKAIEKSGKLDIHATLRDALHKLYGYTSDANGIRHALMDVPTVDYEDAMFMLTTCSAYVSYLMAKAQKAGIVL